jgi:ubiquitin C-terminal hydrolase
LDLSLPIPIKPKHSTVTLEDCLSLFMEKETIDMNWKCDQCHSKDNSLVNDLNGLSVEKTILGHRQYSIQQAPKALILHLKRFSVGHLKIQKMNQFVEFPQIFKFDNILYQLDGIVIHSGSSHGGHYTASVEFKNIWYHVSDTHVRPTELQSILNNQAYILLYSQID